ncbi:MULTISPECIES: hypothetical protein [unclassified Streptococcus]|uniref:hypothetical protein n=1 Tax=unclassified Streptococcus TaxID=2608887 RepID=UPI0010721040|nr:MULTISPECIES: hypothetical protein [unclassified Streptococcus]MBF0786709.1 hypothetical protein [Streptococcus sp. 19428wC2_LYSM12]MCQ9211683.1 hypothetical protein [Streptococcus sp. B01]MCQ9213128.1 hypothetical protein [Streptococcus sp. O1]TFV06459.1 hypothetical protein E4T79_02055 [Streptococcus sp. LYSM12]
MKKEVFYYWEYFCQINAGLCGMIALTMVLFPQYSLMIRLSNFVNVFSFPLILNRKMKTKLRYRFLIAISLIAILDPIWNKISTKPIHLTPLSLFIASLLLSLLALGNYFYQKHEKIHV